MTSHATRFNKTNTHVHCFETPLRTSGYWFPVVTQSFIAEFIVSHPDLALTPTIREVSDFEIRLESQPLTDPNSPVVFYSVEGSNFRSFESALDDDYTVRDWTVTIEQSDIRVYQIRLSPRVKVLTPTITDHGVRVLAVRSVEQGWRIRVHAPDKEILGDCWDHCRQNDVSCQIDRLYSTGDEAKRGTGNRIKEQLTDRQREVARTVTEMGYYDKDGASATEVAAELDISPSTLSTHLRRVTKKVFYQLFQDE